MQLESPITALSFSAQHLFDRLTQVASYQTLMPDSVVQFEVLDDETFMFALKGMPEIKLRLKEKNPYHTVALGAASDKIPFQLSANIRETGADRCEVQLHFNGDFNPMMAMMVKGPLQQFINTLAAHMHKLA